MARRKSVCLKWTLVLLVVISCPYVNARPQDTPASSVKTEITTENLISATSTVKAADDTKLPENQQTTTLEPSPETSRNVKNKIPIRESIKLVANQLLDKPNVTAENTVVIDTRIPPKVKNQVKHKIKTRNEDGEEPLENSHVGEAVPVTMEELESENSVPDNESTTSNEGISTWVLVSNPVNKENASISTESSKTDSTKKPKPAVPKNKNKKPQNNKTTTKRPVSAGTSNNENKSKDSSNVQKNKNQLTQKPKEISSTTTTTSTEATTKAEITKAPVKVSGTTVTKTTTKTKKKNKNKHKISTTTEEPAYVDSALLPTEAKEQEIELEVSTPPVTTKKPKRSSTKKKNKTKKRKTSKPKPDETSLSEIKTGNKTKSAKPGKKPQAIQGVTTQLYNYFSREVMPSVGVGVLGLASLVGIASYFLYPFSTPVRRTFEVDKKDDIYKNNAEDYANDGNGQAEEEMLGTVLAGMPTHAKNKLNPYAGQTAYINRYPVKKEQDLRYRHVAAKYEPSYNTRYPQQKTGLAHGVIYSKPVNYSPQYETRHAYTTEGKFNFDKLPTSYAPYPAVAPAAAVEPIYAAPHTAPSSSSGISSYGSDSSNSVVYGIKPSSESDFKPVYPFESQFYSEATNPPVTYAPTSLYLGSNNDDQEPDDRYAETSSASNEVDESKFVVGNVPKELAESATPAVVPEHGPRKLNRKRRSTMRKRSISSSLEEILRNEKENKDIFISNEIDDSYVVPLRKLAPITESVTTIQDLPTPSKPEEVFTVYASSADTTKYAEAATYKTDIIESVSTIPINDERKAPTETANDVELTTKTFKVYEVFSSPDVTSSPIVNEATVKSETTTFRNMMTETTTELRSETTSTLPPSPSPVSDPRDPITQKPSQTFPEVVTYPPLYETNSVFSFLKRMLEFKVKLGLSIVQNVGDSVEKFLKSFDTKPTNQRFANGSKSV